MNKVTKGRKIVNTLFAIAAITTGYLATAGASQAGWIYTSQGYVYCYVANGVQWCN